MADLRTREGRSEEHRALSQELGALQERAINLHKAITRPRQGNLLMDQVVDCIGRAIVQLESYPEQQR